MKKRFVVEIDVPEGDDVSLCWTENKTGLNCFHDCIASVLSEVSQMRLLDAIQSEVAWQDQILKVVETENAVRKSFTVLSPEADS